MKSEKSLKFLFLLNLSNFLHCQLTEENENDKAEKLYRSENENLSKQIEELSTEVAKANQKNQNLQSELSETAKKCSHFQTQCAGLFNQVVSLISKQQESEEEISSLKRACENLRAQLAEKEAMMVMMRDCVSLFYS
jgi:predicted RNase H-like nuclease (RuvC/YqgF family)